MSTWSVHLPTAGETCVRLRLRPRGERDPWPFTLAVTELGRLGAEGEGRFRSLGSGRGEPLLASQELRWRDCPVHLETLRTADGEREAALALPSWDEICEQSSASEADFWELVDGFAAAVDAEHGAIVDGEPLAGPAIEEHVAVLVAQHGAAELTGWRAARYRDLPRSGLAVLLR